MRPTDVSFDSSSKQLLVAEETFGLVRRVGPVGSMSALPYLYPLIGDGIAQYGGDGGPALEASFPSPRYVTVRRDTDDVFITDIGSQNVRKLQRADGTTGIAFNGTIVNYAGAVAVTNSNGNGYWSNYGDGREGGALRTLLTRPTALAYSATRNTVYVYDSPLAVIRALNLSSMTFSLWAGVPNRNGGFAGDGQHVRFARFKNVQAMNFDAAESVLYIADAGNNVVRAVNMSTGVIRTVAGRPLMQGFAGDGGKATAAMFDTPNGVALSPDTGFLYISDSVTQRVRAVHPVTGVVTTVMGSYCTANEAITNFTGTSTQLKQVRNLLALSGGRLFVPDATRNRVFLYNEYTGYASLYCTGINFVWALSWDNATSSLLVLDKANRVWNCSTPGGAGVLIAGSPSGSAGNTGDGGLATAARLQTPEGMVFLANRSILIADSDNIRLRIIDTATGVINAFAGSGPLTGAGADWCVGSDAPATCSRLVTSSAVFPTNAFPTDVVFAANGDAYVATGSTIRRVDAVTGAITLFAGNSTVANGGDGLPYTLATFNNIRSLAFSPDSSILYVLDHGSLRIRALNMSGGPTRTIIGTGTASLTAQDGVLASTAMLNDPTSIAVHPNGTVYISDTRVIRAVNVGADLTYIVAGSAASTGTAGDWGQARSALINPRYSAFGLWVGGGLDVSPDGRTLAFADTGSNRVRAVDLASGIIYPVAGGGTCYASISKPWYLSFHAPSRSLWVADSGSAMSKKGSVAADGLVTVVSTVNTASAARSMVQDANGTYLYVALYQRVVRRDVSTAATVTVIGGGTKDLVLPDLGEGGVGTRTLLNPADMRLSDDGKYLYVVDMDFNRVVKYDVDTGNVTTVAGRGLAHSCGDGGPAADAGVFETAGITSDPDGNVYFTETTPSNIIRKVNITDGLVTHYAGSIGNSGNAVSFSYPSINADHLSSGYALSAILNKPTFITVKNGALYFYDELNKRVRCVNMTTGNITTVLGSGGSYSAAAISSSVAALSSPVEVRGLAVGADGSIYVLESTAGYIVRKLDAATGNISIVMGKAGSTTNDPDGSLGNQTSLGYPTGLTVLANGDIYVGINPNGIRMLNASTGLVSTWLAFTTIDDISSNERGDIVYSQTSSSMTTVRFVAAGQPAASAVVVAGPDTLGTCSLNVENAPSKGFMFERKALHIAANRSIYIGASRRILHVADPTGLGTVSFLVGRGSYTGCSGSPGRRIALQQPHGLDMDPAGNLYIADRGNSRVWRVDAVTGIATTVVGNPVPIGTNPNPIGYGGDDGPASIARVNNPTDVAYDADANVLYVADRGNGRVRYINLTVTPPTIHAFAGTANMDASADAGSRPTDTALVTPFGLSIDAQRQVVYVAEENAARVRAFPLAR